jgi:hypothetical protein
VPKNFSSIAPMVGLLTGALFVSACATTGGAGGGTPQQPAPVQPAGPSDAERLAAMQKAWAVGSCYSEDKEALAAAAAAAPVQIYGQVRRRRTTNDRVYFQYQLIQYLVEVEKVSGNASGGRFFERTADETPADTGKPKRRSAKPPRGGAGVVIDGPVQPGDLVWVNVRILQDPAKPTAEELVANGTRVWAGFKRLPTTADDPVLGDAATPAAWTTGLRAVTLGAAMR